MHVFHYWFVLILKEKHLDLWIFLFISLLVHKNTSYFPITKWPVGICWFHAMSVAEFSWSILDFFSLRFHMHGYHKEFLLESYSRNFLRFQKVTCVFVLIFLCIWTLWSVLEQPGRSSNISEDKGLSWLWLNQAWKITETNDAKM